MSIEIYDDGKGKWQSVTGVIKIEDIYVYEESKDAALAKLKEELEQKIIDLTEIDFGDVHDVDANGERTTSV